MKNLIWILTGIGNGLFFIVQASLTDSAGLFACGMGLTSLGALAALDALRGRAVLSRLPAVTGGFVGTQVTRVRSLYRLYQMAPALAEKQARFEQQIHQLEILEKQSLVWKRLATEVVLDQRQQERLAPARAPEATAKIRFIAHAQHEAGDLSSLLIGSETAPRRGEKTIVVTDLGFSDVDAQILEDALAGKIELDFWIARKAVHGADLLVLQSSLLRERAGRVADLLEKISVRYDRVLVVAQFEQITLIEQSLLPDAARILNAQVLT